MKKLLLMCLLISLAGKMGYAQEGSGVQTSAAPFLLIVPDARSGGMADMGVSTSADAYAQFFNASRYNFMEQDMLLGVNYTPWMRSLSNDVFLGSVSFAKRINERSTWSAGLRYFSMGSIELSDAAGNGMGTEKPHEIALGGSYSLKLSENFAMSVGGRYVRSDYALQVDNSNLKTVNTFVVDVGAYYQSDIQTIGNIQGRWRAGAALNNLGANVELVEGAPKSQMPTSLKFGTGYEFLMDNANSITANAEAGTYLLYNNDFGSFIYSVGAEYNYNNVFALRTGYFHEAEDFGNRQYATLGGGLAFRNTRLDVSYLINTSDVRSPLENTLRLSLSFVFGGSTVSETDDESVAIN